MATSGTIGQTTLSVSQQLDLAARMCGYNPAKLGSDQILAAKQLLYLLLTSFANQGIQLWTVRTQLIGLLPSQANYPLQNGTIDVLNCMRRQISLPSGGVAASSAGGVAANAFDQDLATACTQVSPNGNISYIMPANGQYQTTVLGIMSAVTRSYTLVLEWSPDYGATWTTLQSFDVQSYADRQWVYFDIDAAPMTATGWRVRETGGSTLSLRQVSLGSNQSDISIGRNNRDEYFQLPNKTFEANQPTVYWFNRQEPQPIVVAWPVPNDPFGYLLAVQAWTQIQDVGALGDRIAVPQRWLPAVQFGFADWLGGILPGVPADRKADNKANAQQQFILAASEEPDSAPINFRYRLGQYTRMGVGGRR